MKRQLGENLKNKYSDSSLLCRLSGPSASPGLRRQRGTFSTRPAQPKSGALTVGGEGAVREAADCATRSGPGAGRKDGVCWVFASWRGNE